MAKKFHACRCCDANRNPCTNEQRLIIFQLGLWDVGRYRLTKRQANKVIAMMTFGKSADDVRTRLQRGRR